MKKRRYINYEHFVTDSLADFKKRCRCGHTQLVPKLKEREYILCSWCGGRLYFNDKKQKEYDRKRDCDEFRSKFKKYIINKQNEAL